MYTCVFIWSVQGETLETVTTAVVCLFASQSTLLDVVPQLGYIPKVFHAMNHKNNAIPKAGINVAHQLANNEVNILLCRSFLTY